MSAVDSPKWWNVAVPGVAVVLALIVLFAEAPGPRVAGAIATLGALVVAWFTLGRRGCSSPDPPPPSSSSSSCSPERPSRSSPCSRSCRASAIRSSGC
ncbi:hypothetical protein [Naasia aerilata]|uniref:hypothetical protein n=1 Tax=Naasia aerilata TaxID=1162966 RepID=UPI00257442CC|nr:hypothetical protein [Naasia aerilata]